MQDAKFFPHVFLHIDLISRAWDTHTHNHVYAYKLVSTQTHMNMLAHTNEHACTRFNTLTNKMQATYETVSAIAI